MAPRWVPTLVRMKIGAQREAESKIVYLLF